MKVDSTGIVVYSEGIQSESFFTVKQDNLAHIFGILRNQLYSNKPLAIIREYCTNAYDAHVEAGIPERPICVHVPSGMKQELRIRDYGFGLSESDVRSIFASYGESTKRNTNNQVGMMGLGSKSAFCYVDAFTIISYHKGTKYTYNAYIDETAIGKVALVHTESSDETGVEIVVNVRYSDIDSFTRNLVSFLKYFKPRPVLLNGSYVEYDLNRDENNPNEVFTGDNWTLSSESSYDVVVKVSMGNVVYPVNMNEINVNNETYSLLKELKNRNTLMLHANIGDVKPSASRESLEYNHKTISFVQSAIEQFRAEIQNSLSAKINSAPNLWTARLIYLDVKTSIGGNSLTLTHNGTPINQSYVKVSYGSMTRVKSTRNKTLRWVKDVTIEPKKDTVIFLNRGNFSKTTMNARLNIYLEENNLSLCTNHYLIQFEDFDLSQSIDNDASLIGANIVDLANVNYVKAKKLPSLRASIKSDEYVFLGDNYLKSHCWEAVELDLKNGEGVYIPLNRFSNVAYTTYTIETVRKLMRWLGHDIPVYGVRSNSIAKLGHNWVYLGTYVKTFIDDYIRDKYLDEAILAFDLRQKVDSKFKGLSRKPTLRAMDNEIGKLLSFLDSYQDNIRTIQWLDELGTYCNKTVLPLKDNHYYDTYEEIITQYSLLKYIELEYTSAFDDALFQYIELAK